MPTQTASGSIDAQRQAVLSNSENPILRFRKFDQLISLCAGHRDGLVANYVYAGFKARLGDRKVDVSRRNN